jgi:hypothetical protein
MSAGDIFLALLAIGVGALFCFAGYLAFRVVIPIWAAFIGFALGAGLVSGLGDSEYLATALGWLVGLAVALVFAFLAYTFYELAVALAMGSIGFAIGASLMVALDVSWTWAIVLVGVVLGVILAAAAIMLDLPMILLLVLGAFGGASAVITGIMLLTGALDTADFDQPSTTEQVSGNGWWTIAYLVLAAAGIIVQLRRSRGWSAPMREAWAEGRRNA